MSVVPDTGMVKVLFMSSVNSNLRQKLMGLLNFQLSSTLIFCLVMPMLRP